MKTDKEFLEEIKAREELLSRGYTKSKCNTCEGNGQWYKKYIGFVECPSCDGKGYSWTGPITK